MEPDAVIIQDVTLIGQVDLFSGLSPNGFVLINTSRTYYEIGLGEVANQFRGDHVLTCPATELALEHFGRPLPNAALLGGFVALTHQVSLDAIVAAIREHFTGVVGERNGAAASAAFALVALAREDFAHASTN